MGHLSMLMAHKLRMLAVHIMTSSVSRMSQWIRLNLHSPTTYTNTSVLVRHQTSVIVCFLKYQHKICICHLECRRHYKTCKVTNHMLFCSSVGPYDIRDMENANKSWNPVIKTTLLQTVKIKVWLNLKKS